MKYNWNNAPSDLFFVLLITGILPTAVLYLLHSIFGAAGLGIVTALFLGWAIGYKD